VGRCAHPGTGPCVPADAVNPRNDRPPDGGSSERDGTRPVRSPCTRRLDHASAEPQLAGLTPRVQFGRHAPPRQFKGRRKALKSRRAKPAGSCATRAVICRISPMAPDKSGSCTLATVGVLGPSLAWAYHLRRRRSHQRRIRLKPFHIKSVFPMIKAGRGWIIARGVISFCPLMNRGLR